MNRLPFKNWWISRFEQRYIKARPVAKPLNLADMDRHARYRANVEALFDEVDDRPDGDPDVNSYVMEADDPAQQYRHDAAPRRNPMKFQIGDVISRNGTPLPKANNTGKLPDTPLTIIGIGKHAYFIEGPEILMIDDDFAERYWDKQGSPALTEFLQNTIGVARKDGSAPAAAQLKRYVAEHHHEGIRAQIIKHPLWRELMPLVAEQLIADADVTRKP